MVKIDKSKYEIRKRASKKYCRIIEEGKFCKKELHKRGLCTRHDSYFRLHDCLEDFAAPNLYKKTTFQVKQKVRKNVCRLIDGGNACSKRVTGRGLCSAHYNYFHKRDLLDVYGERDKKFILHRELSFNRDLDNGVCGLVVDGEPCLKLVEALGLCKSHYNTLRNNGIVEQFSKPRRISRIVSIGLKKKIVSGRCRIIKNGKSCIHLVYIRGVCKACHSMLLRHDCLDKYAAPRIGLCNATYTINKKKRLKLCRIKANGDICDNKTYSRGLCRKHYSNFWSRGTLEKFAES